MARVPALHDATAAGCDGLTASPITPLHYCTSAKGMFDATEPFGTTPDDMTRAVRAYASVAEAQPLAIFFHGGLVSKADGIDTAQKLLASYSSGGPEGGHAYPYFFVWESSLFETLAQNLPAIAGNVIFRQIFAHILPIVQEKVDAPSAPAIGASVALLPQAGRSVSDFVPNATVSPSEIAALRHDVQSDPLIAAESARIAEAVHEASATTPFSITESDPQDVQAVTASLLSRPIIASLVAEAVDGVVGPGILAEKSGNILVDIIRRFAEGRAHGLQDTIVEEMLRSLHVANVGYDIWADMKDATQAAFTASPMAVGTRLIEELTSQFWDGGKRPRIVLIGHSAGAVYIRSFLEAIEAALSAKAYRDEIVFDVVVLAAAVRVDTFANILPRSEARIANFRWFSMNDELERSDVLIQDVCQPSTSPWNVLAAGIYSSSLLYFISGVLEDDDDDTPILGMARYFAGNEPYSPQAFPAIGAVAQFFAKGPNRRVFSDTTNDIPTPPVGLRSSAHHHGPFPKDAATMQSVCAILRDGFGVSVAPGAAPSMLLATAPLAALAPDDFLVQCRTRLATNEGDRVRVYDDTRGIPTIGIGFNLRSTDARRLLQQVGANYDQVLAGTQDLTVQQVDELFQCDLANAVSGAQRLVSNYDALIAPRRFVVVDMIFNLGPNGFAGFVNTRKYIESANFELAARNMTRSLWYAQVADRGVRDVTMMRTGAWDPPVVA
jgi:GH24 family phage-related lysozyme (muramidase)